MSDNLQQIVYISSAEHPFTDEEFAEMLAAIRENNEKIGVTGMLLYKDGDFIQVIEGEEHVLTPLYTTICQDNRHYSVVEMMRKPIVERQFKNWSMGFHHINNDDPRLEGFKRFFDDDTEHKIDPGEALSLLLIFRD
ncbi:MULTISPECIES: BLUF domain-containing protein [Grimontia]|uniref:Blue light-and temperature-regulated antirepressor YcgF n=1 Tax=Grimontia marina TaxID=646534 RepID=A0A128FI92_9GAMM|nr:MULTISPECIES: BLUF domain-containing protein [Grimontia]WRV97945.1 BLUF domain-containing protein [Grimontia sp. NTOU-MAR1]CZF86512.1 Blue light-and temperature-regulated antirepressor YcgF [Grimontia marina]